MHTAPVVTVAHHSDHRWAYLAKMMKTETKRTDTSWVACGLLGVLAIVRKGVSISAWCCAALRAPAHGVAAAEFARWDSSGPFPSASA